MSIYEIFPIAFSFFLLMDPIGNIPLFAAILKELPRKRQLIVITREMLIALFIILLFYFIGDDLFSLLEIEQETLQISGGIILFIIALKLIFPSESDPSIKDIDKEPFIVPLAIPLVAGPAIIAAVMIYSHRGVNTETMLAAILLAWIVSLLILTTSPLLERVLGKRGIIACERLMGFILTLIGLQMLADGARAFFNTCS